MDAKYYADVAKMVDDALAVLVRWEKHELDQPPIQELRDIGGALLDGGKVHSEIIDALDARSRNKFSTAALQVGKVGSYERSARGNVGLKNALDEIKRVSKFMEDQKQSSQVEDPVQESTVGTFVNAQRIAELRKLELPPFDPLRLIRLLEELNDVYMAKCYMATIMVMRAILDHVPPVFGCKTFAEVASNYGGGKSFKEAMDHLEKSSRKIADGQLHSHIRKSEIVPTAHGAEFRAPIDLLIGEVTRLLRKP